MFRRQKKASSIAKEESSNIIVAKDAVAKGVVAKDIVVKDAVAKGVVAKDAGDEWELLSSDSEFNEPEQG